VAREARLGARVVELRATARDVRDARAAGSAARAAGSRLRGTARDDAGRRLQALGRRATDAAKRAGRLVRKAQRVARHSRVRGREGAGKDAPPRAERRTDSAAGEAAKLARAWGRAAAAAEHHERTVATDFGSDALNKVMRLESEAQALQAEAEALAAEADAETDPGGKKETEKKAQEAEDKAAAVAAAFRALRDQMVRDGTYDLSLTSWPDCPGKDVVTKECREQGEECYCIWEKDHDHPNCADVPDDPVEALEQRKAEEDKKFDEAVRGGVGGAPGRGATGAGLKGAPVGGGVAPPDSPGGGPGGSRPGADGGQAGPRTPEGTRALGPADGTGAGDGEVDEDDDAWFDDIDEEELAEIEEEEEEWDFALGRQPKRARGETFVREDPDGPEIRPWESGEPWRYPEGDRTERQAFFERDGDMWRILVWIGDVLVRSAPISAAERYRRERARMDGKLDLGGLLMEGGVVTTYTELERLLGKLTPDLGPGDEVIILTLIALYGNEHLLKVMDKHRRGYEVTAEDLALLGVSLVPFVGPVLARYGKPVVRKLLAFFRRFFRRDPKLQKRAASALKKGERRAAGPGGPAATAPEGVRSSHDAVSEGATRAGRRAIPLTKRQIEAALRERFPTADAATIQSHLDGIDLRRPVEIVKLKAGDRVDVWVRDGGLPGAYGTTAGTSSGLGIPMNATTGLPLGRHLQQFVLTEDVTVMRSTAARYAPGRVPGVGGDGGGTQYLLPSNFLSNARRRP
jgi:hypothetical protein